MSPSCVLFVLLCEEEVGGGGGGIKKKCFGPQMRPVFWASGTSGCVLGKGDLLHLTLGNEPESKTDIVSPSWVFGVKPALLW